MQKVGVRSRWLLRPIFVAAVVVLLLNDHLFKTAYPGWWTGKLSDFAGVVLVAVLLAVGLGPRAGVLLTAGGFFALKAVPGVAGIASPVLGGTTLRDPSDLIALAVLPLVWFWLRRAESTGPSSCATPAPPADARSAVHWGALGAATLPALSLCAAMVVTTATSCGPRSAVTEVAATDGAVYARVSDGWSDTWARSGDGGRSWDESGAPAVARADRDTTTDPYGESEQLGPKEACTGDVCYSLREQRSIERRVDGEPPVEVFRLTQAQFSDISTTCTNPQRGVLESIATTGPPDQVTAVASLGAAGVQVISPTGESTRVPVLEAGPPEPPPNRGLVYASMVFGPVLAVGIWLAMRTRWPSWQAAIVVALAGWAASFSIAGVAAFFELPRMEWWLGAMLALTLLLTVAVGRNPRFGRRPDAVLSPPSTQDSG